MEFYLVLKNQDEDKNVTSKLIGKYPDKDSAIAAGNEEFKKLKSRNEWIICVTGNVDDSGNINGAYRLYNMWS